VQSFASNLAMSGVVMVKTISKLVVALVFTIIQLPVSVAAVLPPKNSWLADSIYALGHGDSAQQDAVAVAGPSGPSRALSPNEIQYRHVGPAHFGAQISSPYPNGKRVFWGNGLDRIVKMDHDSFVVLDEYIFDPNVRYSAAQADEAIEYFDDNNDGFFGIVRAYREAQKLRDLSGVYTVLDRDNIYYIGSKEGVISAYGDKVAGDQSSAIEKKREFKLPAGVTGLMVGMNMTFDGWLVVATEHGWVVAVKRDFSEYRLAKMRHSDGAEQKATRATGYGWVRNGFAIDKDGGIYIASQAHIHKLVWTGSAISTQESAGAWVEPYNNEWGHGTGATPSLMGFGGEDQFVVITDGAELMNVTLFWRNTIPEDWKQIESTPSFRIAGLLPANMGNPDISAIQSEQSVVVAGYSALVVNNKPRNAPWYLPERAQTLLISFLGSNPRYQPFGVQKFEWNPENKKLEMAWVNNDVSSPSCVPIISYASKRVYLIGARDDQWTLEAIDLDTGESDFHYVIGGQRYNVLFAGTLLDEDGRIHYGTHWGRVRLVPGNELPAQSVH
jgi:hypothetical protein